MSISEPFIRRPVATTLLMFGLLLAGLMGFRLLPVSALPQVDYPTIVVSTYLPGASADTMATAVTTPLERQFGQVPALTQMTSVSSFGSSQITLQFDLDRNIDAAEQDVQAAINAASSLLPRTLPVPPTYSKSNPADAPILTLSVSSDTVPLDLVDDYADSILAQKISQVSGVGLVTLNGGQKPAIRVQVDPQSLAAAGLSLEDVRQTIAQANVNQPKGSLDGPRQNYTIATNDQLYKAASFRPLILAYRGGAPIRLGDVANVIDGVENDQLAGWAGEHRAVLLNVQRQPGANVIQVADRVKALLPSLQGAMPQGISVNIMSDRTETVRASVSDVEFTLVLTIVLVVAVIFIFLRSLRATIIPGVAVPLSLLATFGIMELLGYSLNNLSLMALTISTGFVVDDAIVMVENITRFIEAGEPPLQAALNGARQIGFTIVSLTVSLVAVLIPLLFMGGIIGRLFREFAVTLAIAIAVSAVLSLTLTATMCAHMLRPRESQPHGRLARWFEAGFDRTIALYGRTLQSVLAHQRTTLIVTLLTLALTGLLAWLVPKGFFPQQDTGLVLGVTEAAPDVSFPRMMELQKSVADVVLRDPDVAAVSSFIGADGTNPTTNSGRLSISLRPHSERSSDAAEVIARIRSSIAGLDGISAWFQPVQDLQIDNRVSRTQFQYTMEDADTAELTLWASRMLDALRSRPELKDMASDQQTGGLQVSLTIDRDTASRLGISPQLIDDTLYDAFGQRQISTIFTQLNLYRVILEVKPELARDDSVLDRLYLSAQAAQQSSTGATQGAVASSATTAAPTTSQSSSTASGQSSSTTSTSGVTSASSQSPVGQASQVPLSAFVRFQRVSTPLVVSHQGQFPSVTLSFNVAEGSSLGEATRVIRDTSAAIGLPPGVHADFQGTAKAFQTSLAAEPLLILAALITVYIVLGVLYESYIHPVTILSTLPSAGVGALLALMLTRVEFSVIALIGVILLIGIVKKNAIMMIDFALEAERDQGASPRDAIHQACLLRFRPIMMTTAAALLGGIPLALGSGTGSELRRPLGITIVGGLVFSQLLTLYTTPVIYLYMGRLGAWLRPLARRAIRRPESSTP